MSKLLDHMATMLANPSAYQGFLGAYNMGVWGISVTGQRVYQQGLLVSGTVLTKTPEPDSNSLVARNFVKYYDTPNLWGYGDAPPANQNWSNLATVQNIQTEMNNVNAWGHLVNRWEAVIAQSSYLVDITSLSPPITGTVAETGICNGIAACLRRWADAATAAINNNQNPPKLMIRLLFGFTAVNIPMKGTNSWWKEFRQKLEATLGPLSQLISGTGAAELPVVLYGSDMCTNPYNNFNHSKIVAGDGHYAIVGGHNMCEEVSSNKAPVIHDITCEVTGPAALTANAFAGSLWLKAAEGGNLFIHRFNWTKKTFDDLTKSSAKKWAPKNVAYYGLGKQDAVPAVLKDQYWYYPMQDLPTDARVKPPAGSVVATAIMGIGRWGDNKGFGVDCTGGLQLNTDIPENHACQYSSDFLKRLMIQDEKNTRIAMCQQDLVNAGWFGGQVKSKHVICEEIAKRLKKKVKGTSIQVVVSSRFTQNCEGLAYSYGDGPREAAERISDSIKGVPQASSWGIQWPARLQVLLLSEPAGNATLVNLAGPNQDSYCTIAPLAFCEARGTTRVRGSYVWPNAKYSMEKMYTSGRYWDKKSDKAALKFGPGNHSKVLFVSEGTDDSKGLVMIGSDNMYPSPLSEFNFVIEGAAAIKKFREQYWDKVWQYSGRLGFTVMPNGNVK